MNFPWQRIFRLIKRTGDRVVLFNPANPEEIYVMMDIGAYEKIVDTKDVQEKEEGGIGGLTEAELLDKINRDIAAWKSEQQRLLEDKLLAEVAASNFQASSEKSTQTEKIKTKKPRWSIPPERKQGAEEIKN